MSLDEYLKCPGFDKTLAVFPELLPCPLCGHEVEIWSDEKRARCLRCNKMVDPRQNEPVKTPAEAEKFKVTIGEDRDINGEPLYYERYETVIPISALDHSEKYRVTCENCHKYGKNLACPPYSPLLEEYVADAKYAEIICIRMPQEYFKNVIQEMTFKEAFRKVKKLLVAELWRYMREGYRVAGAGSCLACRTCAAEEGLEKCKKPHKKIFSLESLGVNLTTLTRQCFDFDLEWSANNQSADFVCSIGAIFRSAKEEATT